MATKPRPTGDKESVDSLVGFASRGDSENVTIMLLNRGVDPNAEASDGRTALMAAASGGHRLTVQLLLEWEDMVDIHKADFEGMTALHFAVLARQVDVALMLVEYGADPARADAIGESAQKAALRVGDKELAKLLVERATERLSKVGDLPRAPGVPKLVTALNSALIVSWDVPDMAPRDSEEGSAGAGSADKSSTPARVIPPLTAYEVQYARAVVGSWVTATSSASPDAHQLVISDLAEGTSYSVRVCAYNAVGKGPWSKTSGWMKTGVIDDHAPRGVPTSSSGGRRSLFGWFGGGSSSSSAESSRPKRASKPRPDGFGAVPSIASRGVEVARPSGGVPRPSEGAADSDGGDAASSSAPRGSARPLPSIPGGAKGATVDSTRSSHVPSKGVATSRVDTTTRPDRGIRAGHASAPPPSAPAAVGIAVTTSATAVGTPVSRTGAVNRLVTQALERETEMRKQAEAALQRMMGKRSALEVLNTDELKNLERSLLASVEEVRSLLRDRSREDAAEPQAAEAGCQVDDSDGSDGGHDGPA